MKRHELSANGRSLGGRPLGTPSARLCRSCDLGQPTGRVAPSGPVTIPGRSVVYVSPGSANRDEAYWGDTVDQVDITREDASTHLQFGAGIHACLGSHLARLQAEVMFTAILDRFEDIAVAGEPVWSTRMVIRGLNQLPVRARLR